LPQAAAIFDCLKLAQDAGGHIAPEAECYIEQQLGRPVAEQRRLRSQYDLLSAGIPGGASGAATERLYDILLGPDALTIRQTGPLLAASDREPSITAYLAAGGYQAAGKALREMRPESIIDEVKASGLRGRGGAYFPVGVKWEAAARAAGKHTFLICNADEGEPPTRKDKLLLDRVPHRLLEGMLIAGKALDTALGLIYLRGDYQESLDRLRTAIAEAHEHGWLGVDIQGSGFDFEVEIFLGSGSYVAGCDTAMLESLEGRAAIPRATPPFPTERGLAGQPTVVNNVETLCNVPVLIAMDGAAYAQTGDPDCPGTKLFGLGGDIAQAGIYELPSGMPLSAILELAGGVVDDLGAPGVLKAVNPGGVTTGLLTAAEVARVRMGPASLAEHGAYLGSGAITVFNDQRDLRAFAEDVLNFLAKESCGSCIQCPISLRMTQRTLARTHQGLATRAELDAVYERDVMLAAILRCGLGRGSHFTVSSALRKFPDDFLGPRDVWPKRILR
jgi:NADH-quinone oxidoreductase subunit F